MRKTTLIASLVGSVALLAATQAYARNLSYEDNKLNFKACDGTHATARWYGLEFQLSKPGQSMTMPQETIQYLDWDGACQTLSWDKKAARFVHSKNGSSKSNLIVHYVAWDDARWAATRDGAGFYHVFIANKDDDKLADRLADVASWLSVHKTKDQGASILAKQLSPSRSE